jgi:hypothetical protein
MNMAENEKTDLEKALDESLEELQKAADGETISKAAKEEEEAKGDKKLPPFMKKKGDEKDEDKKEDEDAKGDKKDEDEEAKGDKKDDEEAKGDKKEEEDAKGDKKDEDDDEEAMRGGYRKSVEENLHKSEAVQNAVEVSKFLRELTKSQAEIIGDLSYRIRRMEKSQKALADALVKSQTAQAEVIKSLGSGVALASRQPLPRKSIPAGATIEKSFRNNEKGEEVTLSKAQVSDRLCKLECEQKVPMGTTTRYEMTGELAKSHEKMVMDLEK